MTKANSLMAYKQWSKVSPSGLSWVAVAVTSRIPLSGNSQSQPTLRFSVLRGSLDKAGSWADPSTPESSTFHLLGKYKGI